MDWNYKNQNILNEEIYRRPETMLIDNEFKVILDYFSKDDNIKKTKGKNFDKQFETQLKMIEALILKLLNARIIFKFDDASTWKRLSFGMCIYPSTQEMHGKITDAIEHHKEGFYLAECSNALIFIDYAMIYLVIKNKLGPRALTAVLLHELGHKVYVKRQNEILYNGSDDNDPDLEKNTNKSLLYTIILFGIPFVIPFSAIGATVSIILFFLSSGLLFSNMIQRSNLTYVKSEALSDSIALKYGYAKEIYQTMDIFYAMSKTDSKTKSKIIKWLDRKTNASNSSKMRRDELEKILRDELNDRNNTKLEKENIKNVLDEIDKMKTKNEDVIPVLNTVVHSINEAMTFRSIEMDRAKKILESSQVVKKIADLAKKNWFPMHNENDLNLLNRKVIENKIKEMAEKQITTTVSGEVGTSIEVGGERSKTRNELRNIVMMELGGYLCLVEANDKGRIISITTIFSNSGESIKFIRFQVSIFKF